MPTQRLQRDFFGRNATLVARDLLGKRLIRQIDGQRVGGIIVETEAYCASEQPDLACHGTRNKGRPTKRTQVMFGEAGHVYMYFNYGMHWMFNIVTGETGQANALLVRAIAPTDGLDVIQQQRGSVAQSQWTNGPAKLAKALVLDDSFYGADLCSASATIWLEQGVTPAHISSGPRVGLGKTPEPWFSIPWRYWITDNPWVSKYR